MNALKLNEGNYLKRGIPIFKNLIQFTERKISSSEELVYIS